MIVLYCLYWIEWGLRYRVLIDRYTNVIRGIFSGHTHEDSFQIMRNMANDEITGIIHINPALTTYRVANPSFRVYEMDPETFALIDYVQYRLYVEKTSDEKAEWVKAYRFSEFYNVPNLDYNNFPLIINKIKVDPGLFKNFTNMFYAEGLRGPKLHDSKGSKDFLICRLNCSDIYEYQRCIGTNYVNIEYLFGYGIYAKFWNPQWIYLYDE